MIRVHDLPDMSDMNIHKAGLVNDRPSPLYVKAVMRYPYFLSLDNTFLICVAKPSLGDKAKTFSAYAKLLV